MSIISQNHPFYNKKYELFTTILLFFSFLENKKTETKNRLCFLLFIYYFSIEIEQLNFLMSVLVQKAVHL